MGLHDAVEVLFTLHHKITGSFGLKRTSRVPSSISCPKQDQTQDQTRLLWALSSLVLEMYKDGDGIGASALRVLEDHFLGVSFMCIFNVKALFKQISKELVVYPPHE